MYKQIYSMSKIKIAVINWWPESDKNVKNWFVEYMKANFDNIECVNPEESDIDILFSSVFGNMRRIESIKARVKVLFSGESWRNQTYSQYKSEYIEKHYDLILHFDETDESRKRQRFPLWLLYVPKYNMNDASDNLITYVNEMRSMNMNNEKIIFGSCIARHDPTGMRGKISNEINYSFLDKKTRLYFKYKRVVFSLILGTEV